MNHNKYTNYDTDRLLREYEYMTPSADPDEKAAIRSVQGLDDTDVMHLLMVTEAMAERLAELDGDS